MNYHQLKLKINFLQLMQHSGIFNEVKQGA